jgi:hypothetical protein
MRIVGLPAFAQPLRRGGASRSAPPRVPLPAVAGRRGRGGSAKCGPPMAYRARLASVLVLLRHQRRQVDVPGDLHDGPAIGDEVTAAADAEHLAGR